MTTFTDEFRLGAATPLNPTGIGVHVPPQYMLTSVAKATTTTGLGVGATYSGTALAITLSTGSAVSTTSTIAGITYLDLGTTRCLTISGTSSVVTPVNITISGRDAYLNVLTQTLSGPTGTGSVTTAKAFRYVNPNVLLTGNTTSNISFGNSDRIGFVYRADAAENLIIAYSGALVTTMSGFSAASTVTATATTADVRGTYLLPSALDGTKRYTIQMLITDPDTVTGLYGVPQF